MAAVVICPTCLREWLPLGTEDPAGECYCCRRKIGTCALVGGRVRGEVEREAKAEEPNAADPR